jgi:hypothetical protein
MAATASYNITDISAKEQSFDDSDMIKEYSAVPGNSLCN